MSTNVSACYTSGCQLSKARSLCTDIQAIALDGMNIDPTNQRRLLAVLQRYGAWDGDLDAVTAAHPNYTRAYPQPSYYAEEDDDEYDYA